MNLRFVILFVFIVLCSLSLVVAADTMSHDSTSVDQNKDMGSVHHRSSFMNNFSQNHPDFNVWNAMVETVNEIS